MRVLSVSEINGYYAVPPIPGPSRDPVLYNNFDNIDENEELAALMAYNPVNVAPLVRFIECGSPLPPIELLQELEVLEEPAEEFANDVNMEAVRDEPPFDAEEEAARFALLREAEEESSEEEEEAEEDTDAAIDSGIDSIDSDDSTIPNIHEPEAMQEDIQENIDSSASSSSSSCEDNNTDNEMEYDPINDPEREARLHRLLGTTENLWRIRQQVLCLQRRNEVTNLRARIQRVKNRRVRCMRNLNRTQRRRLPVPRVERPQKNVDFCYGCAKIFKFQVARWWWRCDTCGFWLCPDCSTDPAHCTRNEII